MKYKKTILGKPAAKLKNLSSIPGTHGRRKVVPPLHCPLTSRHEPWHICKHHEKRRGVRNNSKTFYQACNTCIYSLHCRTKGQHQPHQEEIAS